MTTSVRSRFVFTVSTNLLRSAISFATGMLLARWLGPAAFGKMAFLLGTFVALRQLLDIGSSTAFFTFMSQKVQSRAFVNAFFAWLALQCLLPLGVIGLLFPDEWISAVWHGEQRSLILLAFAAAFMQNSLWPVFQQAGESQRQTIRVQSIAVGVVVLHLLAVLLLWTLGELGLYAIFAVVAVEYFVAAMCVRRSLSFAAVATSDTTSGTREWLHRYWRYCVPLVPYAWVGFAYEFADRWLLQTYGGSVQQAYYTVSAQFSAIALLATTSILSIFWKEIAEAHHRGDHDRTGMLYRRVSRLLFFVGAAIAGFLLPWAEQLLGLILGAAYKDGATTLAIMLLYPVHQSMGQVGNAMLYATERVRLQVGLGMTSMLISMVITYFVLAPADAPVPGLGLASTGLALKMIMVQVIQVNVVAYIIARLWKWPFDWVHQLVSLLGCVVLGSVSHLVMMHLVGNSWPIVATLVASGALYLLLLSLFIYSIPVPTGLTRPQLLSEARTAWRYATAGLRSR